MRILLLGGTGVLGHEFFEQFKNYYDVFYTSRKYSENKKLIHGNAKDIFFLREILKEKWDVIIDFMVYSNFEFEKRYQLLLSNTRNYIYVSSARVYDNSLTKINENSIRIIDSQYSSQNISLSDYSIQKAFQENILTNNNSKNFTIVRPYITFNKSRIQLIHLEKEYWIQRVLSNKRLVLPLEILDKKTTLTSGKTVAKMLNLLVNKYPTGKTYNLTSNNSYSWSFILNKYFEIINKITALIPSYKSISLELYYKQYGINNQLKYDRNFDRFFEPNPIFNDILFNTNEIEILSIELKSFLENIKFNYLDYKYEGVSDKIVNSLDVNHLKNGIKNAIVYLRGRYL